MRLISLLISFLFTASALAHEGHGMEQGFGHDLFHAILLVAVIALVYKGITWTRKQKRNS